MKQYHVAVVGATGLVGRKMLQVLEERKFPVATLRPFASARSAGNSVSFNGKQYMVEDVARADFKGIDVAFFSAGASVSKEYAPRMAAAGALVIDNSSSFRMDGGVPLVVPEVNPHDIFRHKGI